MFDLFKSKPTGPDANNLKPVYDDNGNITHYAKPPSVEIGGHEFMAQDPEFKSDPMNMVETSPGSNQFVSVSSAEAKPAMLKAQLVLEGHDPMTVNMAVDNAIAAEKAAKLKAQNQSEGGTKPFWFKKTPSSATTSPEVKVKAGSSGQTEGTKDKPSQKQYRTPGGSNKVAA